MAAGFEVTARAFAGQSVEYAMRDPRSGRYLASVTSWFYGPKIWMTDDPAGEWQQSEGIELPEGEEKALERIWVIAAGEEDGLLYAAAIRAACSRAATAASPGRSTAASGTSRTRPDWNPGGGGLCLHTIVPWPGDPSRLMVAISAVGVWLSDDGGASWRYSNDGIVPEYLPEEAREGVIAQHCVHNVRRSAARPERMFMQFHGGVYRSDDAGDSWIDVGDGTELPSDFGFPIVVDPADPDSAYVIPLIGAEDRTTPGGSVVVWETRDAGATLAAVPRRAAAGARLPDRAARGVRLGRRRTRAGAVLRRHVGRGLRLGRCGGIVVGGRGAPPAGVLRADSLRVQARCDGRRER